MNRQITVFTEVKNKSHGSRAQRGEIKDFTTMGDLRTIVTTYGWSHIIWKNNYRSKENFKESSLISLDFDGGISKEEISKRLIECNLNYLITYSQNHQVSKQPGLPACDRFRIIIPLKEKTVSIDSYRANLLFFERLFPEMDMNTLDGARFWFPSRSDISFQPNDLETNKNNFSLQNFPSGIRIRYEVKGLKIPPNSDIEKYINSAHTGLRGEWNSIFNSTAYQLAMLQNDPVLIQAFMEELAPEPLDHKDMKTLKKAISDGKRDGKEQLQEKKKDFLNISYEILKDIFNNRFHVFQDNSTLRKILEEHVPRTVRRIEKEPMYALAAQTFREKIFHMRLEKLKKLLKISFFKLIY